MKVKFIFLIFTSSLFINYSKGQQIPNGGMEVWDTSFTPEYPVDWLTNAFYPSTPCTPPTFTAERTNVSYLGNWAAKLEAKNCIDDIGQQRVYIGFLACGNINTFPQLPYGITFNQRPSGFSFYYKFLKVGTDTGFAKITLLSLDTAGQIDQIIGDASIDILNNTTSYSLITVPINYYSPNYPDVLQIIFGTSKTLILTNQLFASPPGNGAYLGTTLWIDDVSVFGGTLEISEHLATNLVIAPNPSTNYAVLTFNNFKNKNYTFKLFNLKGQLLKGFSNISDNKIIIEKKDLPQGIYFFQIYSEDQILSQGKLIFN